MVPQVDLILPDGSFIISHFFGAEWFVYGATFLLKYKCFDEKKFIAIQSQKIEMTLKSETKAVSKKIQTAVFLHQK